MNNNEGSCSCKRSFGSSTGLALLAISIILMLGAQGYISQYAVNNLWPIFLGLIGIVKVSQAKCGCASGCTCKS